MPVLGVDIGRVLAIEDTDTGVSMLTDAWLTTPYATGSVDVLTRLNSAGPYAGRIHLVSKCGPKVEERTRIWLKETEFFARTGIDWTHLHFVRDRPEKAAVCRRLGVTHFVDDRISVLVHLDFLTARYLFAPEEPRHVPPRMIRVADWQELERLLNQDAERAPQPRDRDQRGKH